MTLWCTYIMITMVGLVNTSLPSHNYHSVFVVRTFKIYSLSNFQVHNKILTTVTVLYIIRSSELIPLMTGGLDPLANISPQFPYLLPLAATSLLSVSLSSGFSDSTYKWDHTVFVFVWLIPVSIMSSRSIHTVTYVRIFLLFSLSGIIFH